LTSASISGSQVEEDQEEKLSKRWMDRIDEDLRRANGTKFGANDRRAKD